MSEYTHFLVNHGGLLLFVVVFLEQIGLPIPTVPWLLGAGALWAMGLMNPFVAFAVTVAACLVADLTWFYLGRHRGTRVLRVLCRISLHPDSCVSRTQAFFARYGMVGVVAAKFIPGLGLVLVSISAGLLDVEGMGDRAVTGGNDYLKQVRSHGDMRRNPQQIDYRRHPDIARAAAQESAEQSSDESHPDDRPQGNPVNA